jgi:hypothetical protein
MKRRTVGFMCSAVFALMAVSSHAVAQQKTVRACQEEWRANKAANQANGITEKAYVAECRGGGVTAAPTPSAVAPGPTQLPTSQKTVRSFGRCCPGSAEDAGVCAVRTFLAAVKLNIDTGGANDCNRPVDRADATD